MGMQVSEQNNNGQLCIEIDAGGIFSDYQDYIANFTHQEYIDRLNLKNDLS